MHSYIIIENSGVISQLAMTGSAFMNSERLLLCPQKRVIGTYPDLVRSSPHFQTLFA
jgi:hypothetical protein